MDAESLLPLIGTLITFIVSIGISILVFKKNSELKVNTYFAGFFFFISLGFFSYFIYHITINSRILIMVFYYIARFCYSIGAYFLLTTTFLFLYSEKMDKKYYYIARAYLASCLLGYLFFPTFIDENLLLEGDVAVGIDKYFDLYIIVSILVILIFTLLAFASRLRKSQGIIRKKALVFTIGMFFAIISMLLITMAVGSGYLVNLMKILGIFSMDIGLFILYYGITLKQKKI